MRNAFLFDVAKDLYEKFGSGNNLSNLTIVTPSRRTKLFMNKYFAELSGEKPLWAPRYKNLIQLFSDICELNLYGNSIQKISLVWELYNAYKNILNSNESFDEFYFFGEILLNDFDDIDKALLDPKQVFRIIREHKELENFEHLDSEQTELIQRFFNFNKNSALQNNFFDIWNNLTAVYADFNKRLLHKKIAREGMLMRLALENFDIQKFNSEQYVFVGFNRISKVESILIEKLSSKFIIYEDEINFNVSPNAEINLIEAVNSNMQTGYINEWLKNSEDGNFDDARTAIVLCDEKLLPATLSALPAEIEPNIAILYSLIQSQAANSLICEMEELVKNRETVKTPRELLSHLQEFTEKIVKNEKKTLEIAALSECHKMLNALNGIADYMESCGILLKLIKRLLISVKLSYSGEPAQGLQIMAMSDTRNMDFENILMLSANDGIVPKSEGEISFIPASIRRAFKLPGLTEQEAEEKYNFFRLLKRAENATFVYNIGKNSIGKGEMSRYLMQLLISNYKNIKQITLESDMKKEEEKKEFFVVKTKETVEKLLIKYREKPLSPSAFNKFINCPLQFYFEYAAGIRKPEDLTEEMDAAVIGKIFHNTMRLYYEKGDRLETIIEQILDSKQKLVFQVIKKMAENIIKYDKDNPSEILETEVEKYFEITLQKGAKIKIGGIIDRIDKIGNTVRVVDYKTGTPPKEEDFPKEIAQIFAENRPKKANYMFQIYLYSAILCEKAEFQNCQISSVLLFPLAAKANCREIADFRKDRDEFLTEFKNKLEELFDENISFYQCKKEENCKYCNYAGICGRDL